MAVAYNSHTGLRGPRYIAECRFLDTQDASCDVMTDRGRFLQVQRLEISIPVYSSTPSSSYGFVCHNLSPRAQIFVSLSCLFSTSCTPFVSRNGLDNFDLPCPLMNLFIPPSEAIISSTSSTSAWLTQTPARFSIHCHPHSTLWETKRFDTDLFFFFCSPPDKTSWWDSWA